MPHRGLRDVQEVSRPREGQLGRGLYEALELHGVHGSPFCRKVLAKRKINNETLLLIVKTHVKFDVNA